MKALILVDLQNDFADPKGALYVDKGEQVVSVANRLTSSMKFDIVVATMDWHPSGHGSFASTSGELVGTLGELNGRPQIWWPDHCVWNTPGSELHKNLLTGRANLIIRKGMDRDVDSYSAFFDNDASPIGLSSYLSERDVDEVYIMGLATDYCIKFTALDSIKQCFDTYLIEDGCRAVNINPDDGDKAIREMKDAGVNIINSSIFTKCDKPWNRKNPKR
jgi:nicotinamidase/pyrazinamidase